MRGNVVGSKKISVIISTFNRKQYIGFALDSVLNQTYKNVEIIIIDDCSTDGTEEYIKNNYNRENIKYYKNENNLGCGISRKKAMQYASGDYINFLDDDDKFLDNKYFEKAVKILDKEDNVSIVCGGHIVNDVVNSTKTTAKFPYDGTIPKKKLFINFNNENYPKPIISVAIIRKETLEKANYQDMKILNDTTIFLRAILYGDMSFINKPEAEYLVHGNNISFNCKVGFIIDNLDEKYNVYKIAKENKLFSNEELDKWLVNQIDVTAIYYINGSNPDKNDFNKIINWYKKNIKDKNKIKELNNLYRNNQSYVDVSKNHTLDIVKAICIILIVFIHCKFPGEFGDLVQGISRISIPLLFIISGFYIYDNSLTKIFSEFIKVLKILFGACTFYFIFNIFKYSYFDFMSLNNYIKSIFSVKNIFNFFAFNSTNLICEHLWFLAALCYCYLIQYLIKKHKLENYNIERLSIILLIICYILINATIINKNFSNIYIIRNFLFVGLPFFLMGKMIKRDNIAEKIRLKKILFIMLLCMLIQFMEIYIYNSEIYISTIILSSFLFIFCLKRPNLKCKYLEFIGSKLIVYIYIFYPMVKYLIKRVNFSSKFMSWIYPVVCLLVTIIFSYIVYVIVNKLKFIRNNKSNQRKKGLVIGYLNNNFGDDLFFKILAERYKKTNFYLYPPSNLLDDYELKYRKNKNIKLYSEEKYYLDLKSSISDKNAIFNMFPLILEDTKKMDFYVNIGGSIFIQNGDWKTDDRVIIKEKMKNKPSYILGCNFGPGDDEYYKFYKKHFKEYTDICFRDKISYNLFKSLNNVRFADDIVLNNRYKSFKNKKYNKSIAISVIDLSKKKKYASMIDKYEKYIADIIKNYIDKDFYVNLFSFCKNEGDLVAINRILSKIEDVDKNKVKVFNYSDDIDLFIRKWKQNRYVIGTRFHSMILALACKQDFSIISYSEKTDNYLKNISDKIKPIHINTISSESTSNIKFYSVNKDYTSNKQFLQLDKYLNS